MSKRKYRAIQIKDVCSDDLAKRVGSRTTVAVDVAKHDMFAAVVGDDKQVLSIVKWRHPEQSPKFVELCLALTGSGSVELVMEPSGTYGDALRHALLDAGFPVFRVNPKKTSDAKEVYDGVPSIHDAKSAAVIAWLHLEGKSESWPKEPEHERVLRAVLRELEIHKKAEQKNRARLEGFLARHWPEVGAYLKLGSATLLELLMMYGGPHALAEDSEGARKLMCRVGGFFLATEKVEAVLESARSTFGVAMLEAEERVVAVIAGEARRSQKLANKAERRIEKLSEEEGATREMAPVVGKCTAAVLTVAAGSPIRYENARAYEKGLGLNLKEKSSGKHKGGLHITKRGPGVARMYLYFAVLRLIKDDSVVRAWYDKKVKRQGGKAKPKAIIAIMRKLARALWYVARGAKFDSSMLFDTSRLALRPRAVAT